MSTEKDRLGNRRHLRAIDSLAALQKLILAHIVTRAENAAGWSKWFRNNRRCRPNETVR